MSRQISLVKVPEGRIDEYLDGFVNTSAFTFEGLKIDDKKGMKKLSEALDEAGFPKNDDMIGYHFSGKVMNEKYHLTGNNKYPDDITFLVIPNFYNVGFKMLYGARWFDDIVENNARREFEKHGEEEDYEW